MLCTLCCQLRVCRVGSVICCRNSAVYCGYGCFSYGIFEGVGATNLDNALRYRVPDILRSYLPECACEVNIRLIRENNLRFLNLVKLRLESLEFNREAFRRGILNRETHA